MTTRDLLAAIAIISAAFGVEVALLAAVVELANRVPP